MTVSRVNEWTDAWEDFAPPARLAPAPARPTRSQHTAAPRRKAARPAAARPAQRRSTASRPRAVSPERARRVRHLRALRRDLLVDFVAAFALMLFVFIATAGLGVVALLEIPIAGLVVASFVVEYRRRRRLRR